MMNAFDFVMWPVAIGFSILAAIVMVIFIVFWVLMLIDCAKRKFKNDVEKIVWVLVLLFGRIFGAIAYYIVIRAMNPKGLAKK
ncbi:MAG: PLDc N-terminal domain-containing protein [archaeon]